MPLFSLSIPIKYEYRWKKEYYNKHSISMRYLILFASLLTTAVLICEAAAVVVPQKTPQKDAKIHFLCKPCEKFFAEVKKDLPDVSDITKEILESVINVSLSGVHFRNKSDVCLE
jgi:hypothetical protein